MQTPMLAAVMAELAKRKGRLPDVCEAVPGIDYSWLSKLVQGRIKDPSVNKIQALYDYLFGIERAPAQQPEPADA